jgi:hypothetical protein
MSIQEIKAAILELQPNEQIELGKDILTACGYYADNLWGVKDVKDKFNCTDDKAQDILNDAFSDQWLMEQINCAIREAGDSAGLTSIGDDESDSDDFDED